MQPKVIRPLPAASLILAALYLIACDSTSLAQGLVVFYNQSSLVKTRVYLGGDHQIAGNGPNDYPAGTQDWTGFTPLTGTGYPAQLWFAAGPNQPESSLQPVLPTTTFLTVAAGAGVLVNGGNVALPGVPDDTVATITLRVWDNRAGTVTSWAMAQAAGVALGESPLFTTPPLHFFDVPIELVGLVSF